MGDQKASAQQQEYDQAEQLAPAAKKTGKRCDERGTMSLIVLGHYLATLVVISCFAIYMGKLSQLSPLRCTFVLPTDCGGRGGKHDMPRERIAKARMTGVYILCQ